LTIVLCKSNKTFAKFTVLTLTWKMPSSICFLQKQTVFEFPTKTTQELRISPQGNHPGANVLRTQAASPDIQTSSPFSRGH